MSARAGELGRWGEDTACNYLTRKGYRILERNWRTREGELDIICSHKGQLIFVEVKTRGSGSLGRPGEAVNIRKKMRLIKAASAYLSRHKLWERPARFDFVGISTFKDDVQIEHEKNVIDAREIMGGGHSSWQPW